MTEGAFLAKSVDALLASEMDSLRPLLDGEQLDALMREVRRAFPEDKFNAFAIDLEQLQVYAWHEFASRSSEAEGLIKWFVSDYFEPVSSIYYLALRSLLTVIWRRPASQSEAIQVPHDEERLCEILSATARRLGDERDLLAMPYWARLAYFSVLRLLPNSALIRSVTDRTTIVPAFLGYPNAHTWSDGAQHVIVVNATLEPLLKALNRFFRFAIELFDPSDRGSLVLHLLPTLAAITAGDRVDRIPMYSMAFDNETGMKDKIRTDNQLRFTIAHELGHIFLGHHSSRMLSSFYSSERTRKAHFVEEPGDRPPPENAPTSFAQEYEADTFALNIYNAFALTEVGFATGERDDESNGMQKARAALIDSMSMREDVEIAFNYWRLVEAVAARARDERGVPSRPDRYYPSAVQRLAHLRHANPGHIVISGEQRAIEKSVDAMIDTLDELSDDAFRSASTRQ